MNEQNPNSYRNKSKSINYNQIPELQILATNRNILSLQLDGHK